MKKSPKKEEPEKKEEPIEMEELHKEIDLIQNCINRMAQNSFLIKGWTVTLFAVILALLPEKIEQPNRIFLGIIMLVISNIFWCMDSFFLAAEKNYREMYSWILKERHRGNRKLMYELDFEKYEAENLHRTSICEAASSNTLRYFYGIPAGVSVIYSLIQVCSC